MKLARTPCVPCKADTLHKLSVLGLQCLTCQTVTALPSQQRSRARGLHAMRMANGTATPSRHIKAHRQGVKADQLKHLAPAPQHDYVYHRRKLRGIRT
jgi:hypothetical protein